MGVLQQQRLAALLEADIVIIRKIIDADDMKSVLEQAMAQMIANEP